MLIIRNLSIFVEKKEVVTNFSLEVLPGSLHLLTGPNGVGKSSIVQALLGNPAYVTSGGYVTFQNQDVLSLASHERVRKGLFVVQQEVVSFPGFSVAAYLKAVHEALCKEMLNIQDFLEQVKVVFTDVGLDHSFIERSVYEGFSGGQKKRFELAQVMLFQPQCVIFDEIDAGLDQEGQQLLIAVIQKMRSKNTQFAALFISHNLDLYTIFKDIIVHQLLRPVIPQD
ncbi:ATP-binding cassette domain-containing protein [Candidatus Dependentiae bacterium]|nr:MAG: ATP-binding cassette domain-containing protein [Candidatus Dependentiae bacterium]